MVKSASASIVQSKKVLICSKVVLLILLFVYALIKFTWPERQYNFVAIFVGSLSPKAQATDDDRRAAHSAAGILKLACENFGQGMRLYYFAVAVLMWFVPPVFLSRPPVWSC